jgi:hypothetical protein
MCKKGIRIVFIYFLIFFYCLSIFSLEKKENVFLKDIFDITFKNNLYIHYFFFKKKRFI